MGVSIDPRKAHSAKIHGDILAIHTWVNDERALVLMPAHRAQGAPWFIICEPAAWKYDEPEYLAKQSRKAAAVMGMDETTSTWFRIAKLINEGLSDLIRMPPAPEPEYIKAALGAMHLRGDGELLRSEEIRVEKPMMEFEAARG